MVVNASLSLLYLGRGSSWTGWSTSTAGRPSRKEYWCAALQGNVDLHTDGAQGASSNLCHTGYLQVVRRLLEPLATLLSSFEKSSAVLFTGHSSGAAIASLLYAHIKTAKNTALAEVGRKFTTVHCVVFGAPPISICPLQESQHKGEDGQDSLFLSFLNEGDPIVDADVGALARRCIGPILAWTSAPCRQLSSSTLAAAQRSQAFVLSGTILLISAGPDDLLQVHAQQCSDARLPRGVTSTWSAHRVVVYQERIASLYASMKRGAGSTADTSDESATAVNQQPCSRDTLPWAQACWMALNYAWVFQLVAACMWLAFCVFASSSIQTG